MAHNSVFSEDKETGNGYRRLCLDSLSGLIEKEEKKREKTREEYFDVCDLLMNRDKYVSKLRELIGRPLFDSSYLPSYSKTKLGEDDDCEICRVTFGFDKGIFSYGLLFVPFGGYGKLPLCVCLHGGDGTPELMSGFYGDNYYSDIVSRLLKKEFCVFAPQLILWDVKEFGNRFSRDGLDSKLKMLGSSMTAFECELISGEISLVSKEDFIDEDRICMAGLSYGAYYSIFVSSLDTRIKAVYASGIVNDRMKYPRPDFAYFNASSFMLDAEVCSLVYPRALYIEAGKHDAFFDWRTAAKEAEKIKDVYSKTGREQRFVFSLTEEGHKYSRYDDGIDFIKSHLE